MELFTTVLNLSLQDPTIRERAPVAKLDYPAAAMVQMEEPIFQSRLWGDSIQVFKRVKRPGRGHVNPCNRRG